MQAVTGGWNGCHGCVEWVGLVWVGGATKLKSSSFDQVERKMSIWDSSSHRVRWVCSGKRVAGGGRIARTAD